MRSLRLAAVALAIASMSLPALAGNGAPDPGSILLFPIFESSAGNFTAITVTNSNSNFNQNGNLFAGTVDAHFIYVNGDPINNIFYCSEFDRTRRLTPNDTITVASNLDNTSFSRGYLFVTAVSPTTGQAISWNYLIGSSAQISTSNFYELDPFVFRAGRGLAENAPTDFSPADGERNLDGSEYERVVDKILVPHFFAEGDGRASWLVLINLTGAGQFHAVVHFLIYNDNENAFSANFNFRCWTKRRLQEISGAFTEGFLDGPDDNPNEQILGGESGWYRLDGGTASSTADSVSNAAILAVQISSFNGESGAELPFTTGLNPTEGELLSQNIFHD